MFEQENRRETRSMNDRARASMSKSSKSVDHNYNLSNPSSRAPTLTMINAMGVRKLMKEIRRKLLVDSVNLTIVCIAQPGIEAHLKHYLYAKLRLGIVHTVFTQYQE